MIFCETRKRSDTLLEGQLLEHKMIVNQRLTSARLFQGRIIDLATAARLESDHRCAARAREELLAVAAMPDWGSAHFLDVAEYALGVAIGLDWLHDFLSGAERDTLATALIERAIQPTFDKTSPSLRWLGGKSNWTQVCHAGLAAAALAIADRDASLAAKTIARAIQEQAGPNSAYAPDGVYPEGPMYWAYGTTFEVILISLLEHAFGTNYGLAGYPGFLASADYLTQVTTPSGLYFNYADAREFVPPRPVLHWFAQIRAQPKIAEPEMLRLQGKTPPIGGELQSIYERHDALALWWHRPGTTCVSCDSTPPLGWLGQGENPVAVLRSSWANPRSTYLGIKGGSPSTSHAHMDSGSFILEADGIRWAVDPGMQDYHTLEGAGVNLWDAKQDGERWKIFRIGPEAHNILRFNNALPRVDGHATFVEFRADNPAPYTSLDLTPLYSDHAANVRRKVSLLEDRSVAFEDEWNAGRQAVEVAWQWLTRAKVTVDPGRVILHQNGKTLVLQVGSTDAVKIEVEDLSQPPKSFDQANPGLSRICILTQTPAGKTGRLHILARPGSMAKEKP